MLVTLGNMVLERAFISDNGEDSAHSLFAYSLFRPQETGLWFNTVDLLKRWSWKGCWFVMLGKTLLCTFIVHISKETELQFGTMALNRLYQWKGLLLGTLGKTQLSTVFVQVFWETELWVDVILLLGWSWKATSVTLGKPLYDFFQVFWETELQVDMIALFRRWSWQGHLVVTLGKIIFTYIVQVVWETKVWVDMIVFLKDGLEMVGHLVVRLGKAYMVAVVVPWDRGLQVGRVLLGNGLEIVGCSVIAVVYTLCSHCWLISWSWNICLCVQLDKVPLLQETL